MDLILHRRQFLLKIHDSFDLRQEPSVDFGEVEDFVDGEARAEYAAI
jgi:hypothetical protein